MSLFFHIPGVSTVVYAGNTVQSVIEFDKKKTTDSTLGTLQHAAQDFFLTSVAILGIMASRTDYFRAHMARGLEMLKAQPISQTLSTFVKAHPCLLDAAKQTGLFLSNAATNHKVATAGAFVVSSIGAYNFEKYRHPSEAV